VDIEVLKRLISLLEVELLLLQLPHRVEEVFVIDELLVLVNADVRAFVDEVLEVRAAELLRAQGDLSDRRIGNNVLRLEEL